MQLKPKLDFSSHAECLNFLASLLELALYAPDGEVTFEGRAAIQRAARQIVVLSREVTKGRAGSPCG